MSTKKISELPSGTANANAIVPATNAAGTTTQKVTLGSIAALGGGAPAAHKTSHATGGSDALAAADIGAAAASHSHSISDVSGLQTALDGKQASGSYASASHSHAAGDITSGTINAARLGSGSATSSTFLRGDGTWATPAAGSSNPTVVALTYSSTLATDASAGAIFDVTLTGNVTLSNPINGVNGQTLRWRITQDTTGGRTITLGNKFAIPSSATSPLAFSTAASKTDILAATYHSSRDKWDVIAMVPGY